MQYFYKITSNNIRFYVIFQFFESFCNFILDCLDMNIPTTSKIHIISHKKVLGLKPLYQMQLISAIKIIQSKVVHTYSYCTNCGT